ncbi:hypothetical protein THAOC_11521, partial [Thalassiosira oceanica]
GHGRARLPARRPDPPRPPLPSLTLAAPVLGRVNLAKWTRAEEPRPPPRPGGRPPHQPDGGVPGTPPLLVRGLVRGGRHVDPITLSLSSLPPRRRPLSGSAEASWAYNTATERWCPAAGSAGPAKPRRPFRRRDEGLHSLVGRVCKHSSLSFATPRRWQRATIRDALLRLVVVV